MTWLLWRQHRSQALFSAIAFAAFAILLWITGVHFADTYRDRLGDLHPYRHLRSAQSVSGDGALIDIVNLSAAVPLLMGLFWGVPSVGGELDSGTTCARSGCKSVRRRDWLNGKIAVLLIAAALWGAAIAATVTWWSATLELAGSESVRPWQVRRPGHRARRLCTLRGQPRASRRSGHPPRASRASRHGRCIRRGTTDQSSATYGRTTRRRSASCRDSARQTTLPSGSWILSRTPTLHGHHPQVKGSPGRCNAIAGSDRKASDVASLEPAIARSPPTSPPRATGLSSGSRQASS